MTTESWEWTFNPAKRRWETYKAVIDWPNGLFKWLHDSFGRPGLALTGWDYHGGWIYFSNEGYLALFRLRWS